MLENLAELPHYLLSFVIVLSVIVFVHEFGHYLAARLCGVKVETFSIGFGREIFGFTDRAKTRWKVSVLPLGGYVKMFGDAGAASTPDIEKIEHMSDADKRISFHHQPLRNKAIIVAAGPIANFILTIAVFTFFIFTTGLMSTEPVVGGVLKNSPAAEAGLKKGDRIIQVDDKEISRFNDIADYMMTNLGDDVQVILLRNGTRIEKTITPRTFEEKDAVGNTIKRPLIGIRSQKITYQNVGIGTAVWEATKRTYGLCASSLKVMGQMISGDRSADELKGPVGIAKLSGDITQQGETLSETVRMTLWFIALLSANLGLVNLFPIPMLDGGHLAFYALEAVRGRPIAERFQEYGYRFGVAVIATLMAFTLFNDIKQLFF
ncbi:MAG: RIP metalloprotease RseP [Alphaproteobacteria bacterium]|nr:RIP metalloprotease RseP [Alphaproteobacteria bacterium]